jgi:hypothetical protein
MSFLIGFIGGAVCAVLWISLISKWEDKDK